MHLSIVKCVHSSPDSDDTLPGDESEEFGRDDTFLMNSNTENKFYGKFLLRSVVCNTTIFL